MGEEKCSPEREIHVCKGLEAEGVRYIGELEEGQNGGNMGVMEELGKRGEGGGRQGLC